MDLVFSHGLNIGHVCSDDLFVSDRFFDLSFNIDPLPYKELTNRHIINHAVIKRFSAFFDSVLMSHGNDVKAFVQSFNEQCSFVLDA